MGLGFTIDTPVKVAHYGISSVISIVDDILIEKMREFYSKKIDQPYQEITERVEDFSAKRLLLILIWLMILYMQSFRNQTSCH